MKQAEPSQLSSMLSVAYGGFSPVFRGILLNEFLLIADSGQRRRTNPNKPNGIMPFSINHIATKCANQTQSIYRSFYQLITDILAPLFAKFGWIGALHHELGSHSGEGDQIAELPAAIIAQIDGKGLS